MYTGTLIKCEQRRENEVDYNFTHRYSPNTEHYIVFLDCAIRLDDGSTIYFKTPSIKMWVSNGSSVSIVTYNIDADHPWFVQTGGDCVATRDKPNDNRVVPVVSVGDTLTIKGRVKTDTVSKVGNRYKVLTHVKRLK